MSNKVSDIQIFKSMNLSPAILNTPLKTFSYENGDFNDFKLSGETKIDFSDSKITWKNILTIDGPILLYDFDLVIRGDCANSYSTPTLWAAAFFRAQFNELTYRWMSGYSDTRCYQVGFSNNHSGDYNIQNATEMPFDNVVYMDRDEKYYGKFISIDAPLYLDSGIKIDFCGGHSSGVTGTDEIVSFTLKYKIV